MFRYLLVKAWLDLKAHLAQVLLFNLAVLGLAGGGMLLVWLGVQDFWPLYGLMTLAALGFGAALFYKLVYRQAAAHGRRGLGRAAFWGLVQFSVLVPGGSSLQFYLASRWPGWELLSGLVFLLLVGAAVGSQTVALRLAKGQTLKTAVLQAFAGWKHLRWTGLGVGLLGLLLWLSTPVLFLGAGFALLVARHWDELQWLRADWLAQVDHPDRPSWPALLALHLRALDQHTS